MFTLNIPNNAYTTETSTGTTTTLQPPSLPQHLLIYANLTNI